MTNQLILIQFEGFQSEILKYKKVSIVLYLLLKFFFDSSKQFYFIL